MDEKSLIKQAIRGDKNAFASLYALYKDDLYRYAYFRLGNADDANDAVSSCVTAAYEGIYKLRAAGAFKGWIFKILYYSCGKLIADRQQQHNRADVEELDRLPSQEDHLSPELQEALASLGETDREIVLLGVVAGYNSKEIASMLGFNASTVRSRQARALAKMKAFLE